MLKTQQAISAAKRIFEDKLSSELKLTKVVSPSFVASKSGVQDDLNGTERPVRFSTDLIAEHDFEIVHSLAKWKRYALWQYHVPAGEGIYTDMRAIRADEPDLSSHIHSMFVDQWDWEKTITPADRNLDFLKQTVETIYAAILHAEVEIAEKFGLTPFLPKRIHFVHTEDLVKRWPDLSPRERENEICKELGAVFLIGIGGHLSDGKKHDGRAPDYDDWTTATHEDKKGLNGDIMVWNPILKRGFEISSMGIRVDAAALLHQLELTGHQHRKDMPWHKLLLEGKLPLSIGGGIGQSRLVMLLLQKKHIGEVHVSAWPKAVIEKAKDQGIDLL